MTIGISGDNITTPSAPPESADQVAPGTIPENGLAVLSPSGLIDRVRSDLVGTGRFITSDQDPLQILVQSNRALILAIIDAFNLQADVDDYMTAAAIDHPIN